MSVKNIKLDGKTYYNVSKLKVLNADNTSVYNDFLCTDDATISASKVLLGAVGYGTSGKIIGGYVPANLISENATGNIYADGINFLDEYGCILYSYQLSDLPLSELPAVPTVSGYSFTWTKTLQEVNALEGGCYIPLDITATTLDTYVYPSVNGWATGYTYSLYFSNGATAQSLTIDWGDGSSNTTISLSANSTNTSTSHYFGTGKGQSIIKITSGGEKFYLGGAGSGTSTTNGFGGATSGSTINICKRIGKVKLGKNVSLAYNCFSASPGTSSSTTIAQAGYPSIQKILIPNSCTYIGKSAFNNCIKLTSIVVPGTVTSINDTTFYNCYGLSFAYFGEGLTSIGTQVFYNLYSIKTIYFPSTLTTMGTSNQLTYSHPNIHIAAESWVYTCQRSGESGNCKLFINGKELNNITVPNTVTTIYNYAFSFGNIDSVTLPSTITSIGTGAFAGSNIKSIDLSNTSITAIPTNCFYQCFKLESVILPSTVTSIESQAFYYCYNLSQVSLNEGLTSIGSNAFGSCYALTTLTIPSTVTSIGSTAFPQSYPLLALIMNPETPPTLSYSMINDCKYYGMLVYIPSGTLSAYQSATNWSALSGYYVQV